MSMQDRPPRETPQRPASGTAPPSRRRGAGLLAKENRRLVAGVVLGAVVAVFAVSNLDDVEVNWIFGTLQTPLIVVIALSVVLGAVLGWIAGGTRRRKTQRGRP